MNIMKNIRSVAELIVILTFILITPFGLKEDIDKDLAKTILYDTYDPLVEIVIDGHYINAEKFSLETSLNEVTFIGVMSRMKKHHAKSIYEDLLDGDKGAKISSISSYLYIPTIHNDNSIISKAYIKRKKCLIDRILRRDKVKETLVISEEWNITGTWSSRTNYFEKNSNEGWILDIANGTSLYKFTSFEDNPWNLKRNGQ